MAYYEKWFYLIRFVLTARGNFPMMGFKLIHVNEGAPVLFLSAT